MYFDSETIISRELLPDERILWCGQPSRKKLFTKADIFMVPFSIFWCGFAIFWTVTAMMDAGLEFGAFGLLFVFVGLYVTVGRFFVKQLTKKYTYYALTDRRALTVQIFTNGNRKKIYAVHLPNVPQASITTDQNGVGSIIFGNAPFFSTQYINTGMDLFNHNMGQQLVGFFDIEDANRVYDLYTQIKNGAY